MSIARILGLIIACTVGFGAAGGLLGCALGGYAPGYYRSVFRNGDRVGFDPVQVGTGLGITQGVGTGLVIGLVVVVMLAISGVPRKKGKLGHGTESLDDPEFARSMPMRRSYWSNLLIVAVLTLPLVTGAIGMLIGAGIHYVQTYRIRTDAMFAKLRPILEEKPYLGIGSGASSDGEVYLSGKVRSKDDHSQLEDRLRFLFGDEEAKRLVRDVEIVEK